MKKVRILALVGAMIFWLPLASVSGAPADTFAVTVVRGCVDNTATGNWDPSGVTGMQWSITNTLDGFSAGVKKAR